MYTSSPHKIERTYLTHSLTQQKIIYDRRKTSINFVLLLNKKMRIWLLFSGIHGCAHTEKEHHKITPFFSWSKKRSAWACNHNIHSNLIRTSHISARSSIIEHMLFINRLIFITFNEQKLICGVFVPTGNLYQTYSIVVAYIAHLKLVEICSHFIHASNVTFYPFIP